MRLKITVLASILLVSCNNFSSQGEMEKIIVMDSNNLESTCHKFLADSSIRSISVYNLYDSTLCESINSWSHCDKGWTTWDYRQEKEINLMSKAEVLKAESISPSQYEYFTKFLRAKNLTSISRVYNCDSCVDLESGLMGIRYASNSHHILKEDDEFLIVKKINTHWFMYHRDWN